MDIMKAYLKNYRQSPRKVRLIADLVRGKKASDALTTLQFVDKRASGPISKLIRSAMANAKDKGAQHPEALIIKKITVDKGVTYKRFMPRARGSASPINRRNSNVTIELG